jgi:hypothetical protein
VDGDLQVLRACVPLLAFAFAKRTSPGAVGLSRTASRDQPAAETLT